MRKTIFTLLILVMVMLVPSTAQAASVSAWTSLDVPDATLGGEESDFSMQAFGDKVTKKKVSLKEPAKRSYKKVLPSKTDIKKGKLKKSYYLKERTDKIVVVKKYEKYTKGKRYKVVVTTKFYIDRTSWWLTGKTDLSPNIRRKVGRGLSNAFSKRGYKAEFSMWEGNHLSIKDSILYFDSEDDLLFTLGEFLSVINDNAAYSNSFFKIYEEEKNAYCGKARDKKLAISSSLDYFKYSYSIYLSNASRMKRNMPKTYIFIDDCVKSVNKRYK